MNDEHRGGNISERVTTAGTELMDYIKGLIGQGNIRQLIIRKPNGSVLLEAPLTAGIVVGGVLTLVAPVLAALAAMAALVAKVEVDIARRDEG